MGPTVVSLEELGRAGKRCCRLAQQKINSVPLLAAITCFLLTHTHACTAQEYTSNLL